MVKSRYIGDGHPTFNRNPYNAYLNSYYWVDDHPLLYGNNGSLDPGTYIYILQIEPSQFVDVHNEWDTQQLDIFSKIFFFPPRYITYSPVPKCFIFLTP